MIPEPSVDKIEESTCNAGEDNDTGCGSVVFGDNQNYNSIGNDNDKPEGNCLDY